MQTQLAWAIDAEGSKASMHELAEEVSDRFVESIAPEGELPKSLRHRSGVTIADRIERTLVGLSDNLLATMPPEIKREGEGKLRIRWNTPDKQGDIFWTGGGKHKFIPVARACAQLYGDLDSASADSLAQFLGEDLQQGNLRLPLFQWDDETEPIAQAHRLDTREETYEDAWFDRLFDYFETELQGDSN